MTAEPVAWISEGSENLYWDKVEALADSDGWITPLYKRRDWVGLDEHDFDVLFLNEDGIRFAKYIEAKLKEKNDRQDKR